jgi:hypothetical protein
MTPKEEDHLAILDGFRGLIFCSVQKKWISKPREKNDAIPNRSSDTFIGLGLLPIRWMLKNSETLILLLLGFIRKSYSRTFKLLLESRAPN